MEVALMHMDVKEERKMEKKTWVRGKKCGANAGEQEGAVSPLTKRGEARGE